ncbi:MAG: hypothetical protein ABL858_03325 [Candidatus Nitrotoga sp.]
MYLLTFDAYKKMTGEHAKIADLLVMPGMEDIELEIPKLSDFAQSADFS